MAIVGREVELGRVDALLDAAMAGFAILTVQGEAGVGKSHLLRAVLERARARGMAAGLGRFFDDTLDEGFAAWHEAMTAVEGGAAGPTVERATTLGAAVARELDRVRAAAAKAPVVLAFDDVQWADADTLAIVRQLVRRAAGVRGLLVLVRRTPDAIAPGVAELLADAVRADAAMIALEGLGVAATLAYLQGLSPRHVPEGLATSLHAETRGNPLFLREAMRHLVERGAIIEREDGLRVGASLSDLGVPPGITAVVVPRIGRLGAARPVIEMLAARADGASVGLLARALGQSEPGVLEALSAAHRAGLIEIGATARFAHELVRRAVWDALSPLAKADVHRRLAESLIERPSSDVTAAEIALHFRGAAGLAGAERGVPHALAAARRAGASGAVLARVAFARLARALSESARGDERKTLEADAAVEVARAEVQALDLASAPGSAWAALDKLEAAGTPSAERAAFLAEIARELKLAGVPALVWRPLVERGLALLGPDAGGIASDRLAILIDRLQVLSSGRANVAVWLGADAAAVKRLREAGDEHDFALTVDTHEPRTREETAALSARARTFAEPNAALRVLDAAARDVFFRDGDMAAAAAIGAEIQERSRRAGSIRNEVAASVIVACTEACMGRLDAAGKALEAAAEVGARLGQRHRLHQIGPLASRLVIAYIEGAPAATWSVIAEELDAIVRSPATLDTPFGHVALQLAAMAFGLAGRAAESIDLATIAFDTAKRSPRPYTELGATRDCLAIAIWEVGAPASFASELLLHEWPVTRSDRGSFSSAALSEARLMAVAKGGVAGIRGAFAAAYRELAAGSQHAVVPIARLDEARVIAEVDRGASRALVESALRDFERFGMHGWSARAKALLERAPDLPGGLTAREAELLGLLAGGKANKEIAAALFISVATVERHVANIYDKIGCRSRAAATMWASRNGIPAR